MQHAVLLAAEDVGEPKIGDQQIEIFVQKQVFGFNVSVDNALFVAVLQSLYQLLEVVAAHLVREWGENRAADEFEEFSLPGEL